MTGDWRVDPGVLAEAGAGFRVRSVQVTDPAGGRHQRSFLQSPPVVVIVALTTDDELLLVREFRAAIGEPVLSLPMGKIEQDRFTPAAAARELAEETGYGGGRLRVVAELLSAPGWTDQRMAVVHAAGVEPLSSGRPAADDPEEAWLSVERVPRAGVPALIGSGRLTEARSIAAIALVLGLPPHQTSPER